MTALRLLGRISTVLCSINSCWSAVACSGVRFVRFDAAGWTVLRGQRFTFTEFLLELRTDAAFETFTIVSDVVVLVFVPRPNVRAGHRVTG